MKTPTMLKKEQDLTTADVFTAVGAARTIEHGLLARLDALATKRTHLVGARGPHDELVADLLRQVDGLAAQVTPPLAARLVTLGAPSVTMGADGQAQGIRPGDLATAIGAIDLGVLCALAGDLVKASLTAIVAGHAYPAGPPMADRVRLIAEVDAEIAHVEREHQALVLSAAEVGLVLEELPNNRGRRVAAERAAEEKRKLDLLSRLDKGPLSSRELAWNEARLEEHQQP